MMIVSDDIVLKHALEVLEVFSWGYDGVGGGGGV